MMCLLSDATDNESADDASEDKVVPVVEDDQADPNHVADLFDALNLDAPRYRSQVMVRNGQAHAVGFGYRPGNFYESNDGNMWDMSKPPPGDCFECGGKHWRKDCPV